MEAIILEVVVSNSSVIIALARICSLDLLEKLFGKIIVPEAVWREVTVEGKPGSEKMLEACFIHVEKVCDEALISLLEGFTYRGEAEVIVLALESSANPLFIDEHEARGLSSPLYMFGHRLVFFLPVGRVSSIIEKAIIASLGDSTYMF